MQKRIFFISFLLIAFFTIILFGYIQKSSSSIVYVDSNTLFNDFQMTRELKTDGEKELRRKTSQIDSLQNLLQSASDENTKSFLLQSIISKKQEIEAFQNEFTQLSTQKIWSKIDTYTKDFAEAEDYDFIIGFNRKEQLLYGKKDKDITKLLLNYINKKYEGF